MQEDEERPASNFQIAARVMDAALTIALAANMYFLNKLDTGTSERHQLSERVTRIEAAIQNQPNGLKLLEGITQTNTEITKLIGRLGWVEREIGDNRRK